MVFSVRTPPERRKSQAISAVIEHNSISTIGYFPNDIRGYVERPQTSLSWPRKEPLSSLYDEVPHFPWAWRLFIVAWQALGGFPLWRRLPRGGDTRKWFVSKVLQWIAIVAVGNALFANYTSYVIVNFQLYRLTGWVLSKTSHREDLKTDPPISVPCTFSNSLLTRNANLYLLVDHLGEGSYLKTALSRLSLLLMTVSSLPCLLHGVFSARRLCRFVNSLLLLIREMQPSNEQVWPVGWVVRTSSVVGVVTATMVASTASHMESSPGSLEFGMLSVPLNLSTPFLLEMQYFLLSSVIGLGFERLSENIKALFMPSVSPSAGWVEGARRTHEQLVSLSMALHELLGPQLLLVVLSCRLSLLAVVYVLASDVLGLKRPLRLMRVQMLDTLCFLLRFLLVCAAGSIVKVKASEVVEHSFRVDAMSWGENSKAKWAYLLNQLDTLRPTTTFGGIEVGLGLMLSLFATTTTYLLVLLQFEK